VPEPVPELGLALVPVQELVLEPVRVLGLVLEPGLALVPELVRHRQ
jgi:hypothetical protein